MRNLPYERITWYKAEDVVCRALGAIHTGLGLAVFIGGAVRFPAPTYTPLLELTSGNVWPYGFFWILAGLVMLAARRRWEQMVGLVCSIFITNLWCVLFAWAAFRYDTAGLTASVAYGGYGMLSSILLGFMVVHWLKSREGG